MVDWRLIALIYDVFKSIKVYLVRDGFKCADGHRWQSILSARKRAQSTPSHDCSRPEHMIPYIFLRMLQHTFFTLNCLQYTERNQIKSIIDLEKQMQKSRNLKASYLSFLLNITPSSSNIYNSVSTITIKMKSQLNSKIPVFTQYFHYLLSTEKRK